MGSEVIRELEASPSVRGLDLSSAGRGGVAEAEVCLGDRGAEMGLIKVSVAERADQAKRKADESRVLKAMAELQRRINQPHVDAQRRAAKIKRGNRIGNAALEEMRKAQAGKAQA